MWVSSGEVSVMTGKKVVLVALTVLVWSCRPPPPEKAANSGKKVTASATGADVDAIRDLLRRLSSAVNTNNSQRSAALFTEHGTLLPHGEDAVVGDDNIRAWFDSQFERFTYGNNEMVIDEVEVGGNWAFARGPFHQTVTTGTSGERVPVEGKYMITFERQTDGRWKVANAIWNLDKPSGSPR